MKGANFVPYRCHSSLVDVASGSSPRVFSLLALSNRRGVAAVEKGGAQDDILSFVRIVIYDSCSYLLDRKKRPLVN